MSHYRGSRQDVKSRTMKFIALDPDIASKYDELDEEDNRLLRFKPPRDAYPGGRGNYAKKIIPQRSIIERHITRNEQNAMRTTGAGTSRKEFISQVTVKNASRSGKNHVLKLLANSVEQFVPFAPKMHDNGDLLFYMTNDDDAQAVVLMTRRIADKYNPSLKYNIYSKRIPAPFESISFANKRIIEQAVKSRYKQQSNSLDLSSFHEDPLFDKHQLSYGLFHNHVMVVVAMCVVNNFPTLRGIRLNNNVLRNLNYVSSFVYAAPDITELDLANNALSRVDELAKLANWNLESVHFENNEFASNFQGNFIAYAHAIHEYFPRVTYLDGRSVQAVPEANSTAVTIPRFRPGYNTDEALRKMAENFLVEYYNFYDGPNGEQTRQQLMNAYDANATFTYSMCFLTDTHPTGSREKGEHQELIGQYIRSSHNIMQQHRWQAYRDRIIYRGPMDIVVALSKLPATEHIKQSFLLDFNLVSNSVMVLLLQGIFRDGKEVLENSTTFVNVKFFARQLAIVPKAEGLAIISDMLQITPVSTARMERYNSLLKNATLQLQAPQTIAAVPAAGQPFASPAAMLQQFVDGMAPPPPSPQTQEGLLPSTSSASLMMMKQEPPHSAPSASIHDPAFRETMVKQFCAFSGMKPAWSEKCLQDCKWSWEDATAQYALLKDKVPREAFV